MIIDKKVNIKLSSSNINHFKKCGYLLPDKPSGKSILVDVDHLCDSYLVIINAKCDYLYYKLGFNKISDGYPDYKYIVDNKRVHKSRFKKSNLKIKDITESKFMKNNGYNKIYDCGKLKFDYNQK